MEVRLHDDAHDFRRVALDVYRRNPVMSTVELMVLQGHLIDRHPGLFITVWSRNVALGAAFQTLRSPLLCGGLPLRTVGDVAAELTDVRPNLGGVHGPHAIATEFAAAWHTTTGMLGTESTAECLHRLETLDPPTVEGQPRKADRGDENVLADWLNLFRAEALGVTIDRTTDARNIRTAKEPPDQFLLWTIDDEPVSMAGARKPTAGVSRIGPVYTPAGCRGHGYGAATTAAAAAWALEAGAEEVVLFTDLTNPAVDHIYQRIGFRPVSRFVRIDFSRSH